jgi:hypothetical protein
MDARIPIILLGFLVLLLTSNNNQKNATKYTGCALMASEVLVYSLLLCATHVLGTRWRGENTCFSQHICRVSQGDVLATCACSCAEFSTSSNTYLQKISIHDTQQHTTSMEQIPSWVGRWGYRAMCSSAFTWSFRISKLISTISWKGCICRPALVAGVASYTQWPRESLMLCQSATHKNQHKTNLWIFSTDIEMIRLRCFSWNLTLSYCGNEFRNPRPDHTACFGSPTKLECMLQHKQHILPLDYTAKLHK